MTQARRLMFLSVGLVILLVAMALRFWDLAAYPPGPHYDEAVNLLIARSIAHGGARFFPIVEAYQGREVLYMYLNAVMISALGDRMFTLHLTNAFASLITVAGTIALGRAMFRGRRGWVIGLLAGLLIALSFPQIWLGRQAFRAVTLPLCQTLALLFLWRGLRVREARRQDAWLALGGMFAGAALYTYMASRLFPLWLLIGGVALLVFDRPGWRLRLRQGVVFFGALALIAAPMAIYALQNPDIFLGRLDEVTQADQSVTLAQSIVLHLRMFFIEGDPYFRYNIPGRPFLTLPEGLLLLIGIAVAAARVVRRRSRAPVEWTAYLLALLSPLMILPSVISVGGLPPSHMRSIGMVPLIFILVAVGAEALIRWLARGRGEVMARCLPAALIVVVLVGGVLVGAEYFAWAGLADVYYEADADLAAAADWLIEGAEPEERIYVAARDRGHPTMMIAPIPPVTWIGTDSLFRAPSGEAGLYIFPRSAPPLEAWRAWLEPGRISDLPLGPDGRTAFEAFRISGDAPLPASDPLPDGTVRNPYLTLVGVHAAPVEVGAVGDLIVDWQVTAAPPFDRLTPLLQIEDGQGVVIHRADVYVTETRRWMPGEVLMQRLPVRIPVGTIPGQYAIKLAWVGRDAGDAYVPYLNASGATGAIWAQVGTLRVERAAQVSEPAALTIGVAGLTDVADGVRLLGWDALPESRRPGEVVALSLYWQAVEPTNTRAPLSAEALIRVGDREWTLWQGTPAGADYPPERWQNGDLLADSVRWRLPRELPAGPAELIYAVGEARIRLGTIDIAPVERMFAPPAVEQVSGAVFGDQMVLYGYTIQQHNEVIILDLMWQALEPVDRDYTVFVHLLDAGGQIVAQRDAMPQDNGYPTSLWQSGEYVNDSHSFPASPNAVSVRIGLYDQQTGARLTRESGSDFIEFPLR